MMFAVLAASAASSLPSASFMLAIVSALGLLGGLGYGIKALLERKTLNATASATRAKGGNDEANAASIVAAAARELIDPLRQELATERAENAIDVERERIKVRALQSELDRALIEVAALRAQVRNTMDELNMALSTIADKERHILALEHEIARFKEARALNEDALDFPDGTP